MARKSASANTEPEIKISRTTPINNSLKLRIDDLKTFDPLTENQKIFFVSADFGSPICALAMAVDQPDLAEVV